MAADDACAVLNDFADETDSLIYCTSTCANVNEYHLKATTCKAGAGGRLKPAGTSLHAQVLPMSSPRLQPVIILSYDPDKSFQSL
jgi:hypothetical protein